MNLIANITSFFYQILINAFSFVLPVLAIFSPGLKAFYQGRLESEGVLEYYELNTVQKPVVWFHCASLGEFEQGRPVIEAFRAQYPHYFILLTFFSPSGYEVRKSYNQVDKVMYLPVDTQKNAARFLKIFRPKVVIFVKYEFWPNFVNAIKNSEAKLIGISVIFRPKQIYFKWYGAYFRGVLSKFDHFFIQNQTSGNLLKDLSFEEFTVSGDTRFDRVKQNAMHVSPIDKIKNFVQENTVLVAGSVWPRDLEVLKPVFKAFPEMKIILVPHDIHPEEINEWKNSLGAVLFSEEINTEKQVLIVDAVGYLSAIYQYADYAYVGGAFGKGLHNILEAAVFGVPVFFGNKNYKKFQEAVDLEEIGVAFSLSDGPEMINKIQYFQDNLWKKADIKKLADQYIESGAGATDDILKYLAKIS
ncbi:MAG: 3-deoxy-D-manno-octulosonic acid transferase [Bacteroidetes bacterium]|nr:3-deoxy-D-manno-octulosonic acid transferase [Bacteroidota bacterium]